MLFALMPARDASSRHFLWLYIWVGNAETPLYSGIIVCRWKLNKSWASASRNEYSLCKHAKHDELIDVLMLLNR